MGIHVITFHSILLVVLLLTSTTEGGGAMVPWQIEYSVTNNAPNTAGGKRFEEVIGEGYAKNAMVKATNFAWRALNQLDVPERRKPVRKIELAVDQFGFGNSTTLFVSYILNGSSIHIGAGYLATYQGDLKTEFTGILYNQVASILEWNGNGEAPAGLTSGIADYVRMKAGYGRSVWVGVGQGQRWNSGYDVTAKFLGYCNKLKRGFVGELNAKMKNGYTVGYFVDILGKNVDQLWSDYKAMYTKEN
ncbi:Basic secretory protease (Fragments) [Linum grandiflorum]